MSVVNTSPGIAVNVRGRKIVLTAAPLTNKVIILDLLAFDAELPGPLDPPEVSHVVPKKCSDLF